VIFATPLLLQFMDSTDTHIIQWTFVKTEWHWVDTMDWKYAVRASHNPSVVGLIPTGLTI